MQISDLHKYPEGYPPSPYGEYGVDMERDDQWGHGLLPPGWQLYPVGWLGAEVRSSGTVPPRVIEFLFNAYETGRILSDGIRGHHLCEVCAAKGEHALRGNTMPIVKWRGRSLQVVGQGHYLIRYGSTVYMCPALTLHYILDHNYQPPLEFMQAIGRGAILLREEDLVFRAYIFSKNRNF